MSEDWLDIGEQLPATLPAPQPELPASYADRFALCEEAWSRLKAKQKTFLAAWRDCRYNQRAAMRQLGLNQKGNPMTYWMGNPDFATVVRVWQANAAANALDKDRLLARQDDIVETLLTPRPVLHQGLPVFDPEQPGKVLMEVDAGAASRANEVLLDRAMPKSQDKQSVEVNVGVMTPMLMQVPTTTAQATVIEAEHTVLPDIPASEEWLEC